MSQRAKRSLITKRANQMSKQSKQTSARTQAFNASRTQQQATSAELKQALVASVAADDTSVVIDTSRVLADLSATMKAQATASVNVASASAVIASTITLADIARELNIDAKRARAKARANVQQLSHIFNHQHKNDAWRCDAKHRDAVIAFLKSNTRAVSVASVATLEAALANAKQREAAQLASVSDNTSAV